MGSDRKRKLLIVEVDTEDWNALQITIANTKSWMLDGVQYGRGLQFTNDPEWPEEAYLIEAKVIKEIT